MEEHLSQRNTRQRPEQARGVPRKVHNATQHFCHAMQHIIVVANYPQIARTCFKIVLVLSRITLVPEVFFCREENIKRQTKKRREKTSGYPRCESHYHATIAVNQHHEIDEQATNNDTPVRFLQSGGRVRS